MKVSFLNEMFTIKLRIAAKISDIRCRDNAAGDFLTQSRLGF